MSIPKPKLKPQTTSMDSTSIYSALIIWGAAAILAVFEAARTRRLANYQEAMRIRVLGS